MMPQFLDIVKYAVYNNDAGFKEDFNLAGWIELGDNGSWWFESAVTSHRGDSDSPNRLVAAGILREYNKEYFASMRGE